MTESPDAELSLWVWRDRPLGTWPKSADLLPGPASVSLDSLELLPPTSLSGDLDVQRRAARVERIQGVFLDALAPQRFVQGWGRLQTNRSVWERPMNIGGQQFRRGLGTHAKSEIVYDLGGQYNRFEAWAGPDMATAGSMQFAVVVDGVERWRSRRMVRGDRAERVSVDLAGARELRLLVDDGGDNIMGDHANWADARLLR